jgi:hypothetical protein
VDDDAQGQPLEVLWERELDGQVITAEPWDSKTEFLAAAKCFILWWPGTESNRRQPFQGRLSNTAMS